MRNVVTCIPAVANIAVVTKSNRVSILTPDHMHPLTMRRDGAKPYYDSHRQAALTYDLANERILEVLRLHFLSACPASKSEHATYHIISHRLK